MIKTPSRQWAAVGWVPLAALLAACTHHEPKTPVASAPPATPSCTTEKLSGLNEGEFLDWRTVETRVAARRKDSVVAALKPLFAAMQNVAVAETSLPQPQHVHLLDLNGDTRLDVAYNGPVGAESDAVWLFLNAPNGYRPVWQQWGNAQQLSFDNGRLAALTLLDLGCCAEYVAFETRYAFDAHLAARPVLQRGTAHFTQRPAPATVAAPRACRVRTDSVALRTAPRLDDTSTVMYDMVGRGNVLLKLPKGAAGRAWASHTDSLGQAWRYVEMLPQPQAHRYLMHYKDDLPTRTLGWVRAADVE